MNLVDRVKNILLQPKTEWAVIEPEQTDPKTLYTGYICILALIPAVASFIGTAFIVSFFAGRIGLGFVVGAAISQYVLGLALKLTAYAMTAAWVAGIFTIVPILGWLLSLLGSLYSLYLFYLGAPVMMKVPEPKAVGYTVVVVLVAIVIGIVIGMINASILGMGAVGMMGGIR